jgi:hypothetical protein
MERHHITSIILIVGALGGWAASVSAHIVYPDLWLLPPFLGAMSGAMYASSLWVCLAGRKLGLN